ncbi:tegument protein UL16 [Saimiriine betaherpesvirus 4]|uniref:Tegument protein UL16 n=1 Tax=Saimiriine betaherpesvirus 4 TaxID=1535247 RepID=G8XSZ8_9BETA|nr:tegument protein UL16 [Saimiriine betaherpesvirus 4]AEV80945.1 tegument protein UL16 [Saimiriine betaherpesvirus 4]
MASTSVCCTRDLRLLKYFLQRECVWRRVGASSKHREYVAIASKSATFDMDGQDSRCLLCRIIVLSKDGVNVVCLSINTTYMGSYSTKLHRVKHDVGGVETFYSFKIDDELCPKTVPFAPTFTPVRSTVSFNGMSAEFFYDVCSLPSAEELKSIMVKGGEQSNKKAIRLGGPGAWAVKTSLGVDLYFYLLEYDLYTTCTGKDFLPSLARIVSATTCCGEMSCPFCKDHGTHVDCTGKYVGPVPDKGMCFCYMLCKMPTAPITNDRYMPFLCDSEEATHISVSGAGKSKVTLEDPLESYITVYNSAGKALPLKSGCWKLVKLSHPASPLLLCACPVLKGVVL